VVESLNQRLDGWQRSQRVHTAAPAAPDEDAQQRLRALGYVD